MPTLYIQSNNEEKVHCIQGNQVIKHEDRARTQHLLHEVLTEITSAQPIILSLPCTLVYAECMRHLIVIVLVVLTSGCYKILIKFSSMYIALTVNNVLAE